MLDLDLESHEVQTQYQDHVDLDPPHLNLKHVTNHHHQKWEEEFFIPSCALDGGASHN